MSKNFELLKKIVEEELNAEIMSSRRTRKHVEARCIFAKILRSHGYTYTDIGRYLSKDHTSIIHYAKLLKSLSQTDNKFLDNYVKCTKRYISEKEDVNSQSKSEMETDTVILLEQIQKLNKEKMSLEIKLYRGYARLKRIISLIELNTPVGEEEEMERKIRRLING